MISHVGRRRKAAAAVPSVVLTDHDHEAVYIEFCLSIQASFDEAVKDGDLVFETDTENLFDVYLDNLSTDRQVHNCSACRRFMKEFGGLVTIGSDGKLTPAMWRRAPAFYAPVASAINTAIRKSRVTAPFLSAERVWGIPITGTWSHMAITPPDAMRYRKATLTPRQSMAAKREDFGTVARALADFTPNVLAEALRVLEADAVNRAERFVGPVKWLIALHESRAATKDHRIRDNLLWRAIASAPEGYCHPRASVVGSLLEDIAAGLPFTDLQKRFNAKMHPLMYQRPQAAPTAGAIAAAEKMVEQMGIAPSLERRFARLDEIETIWRPSKQKDAAQADSVFGHLKPKGAEPVAALHLPPSVMTWEKFVRTVLPFAEAIEMNVPMHGNFTAMLAAVHAAAPPILKWDREDRRNTVSTYVYHNGSPASAWGLAPGWVEVTAVSMRPNLWGDKPSPHLGDGGTIVLNGAVDSRTNQGNALFPEALREELHGVRSVIESYSRSAQIQGREQASACGFGVNKGAIGISLRTLSAGRWTTYLIDRWD